MRDEILTPVHNYWRGFQIRLSETLRVEPDHYGHSAARKILKSLPNINIDGTIDFYKDFGGYDDVEILWNVEAGWKETPLKKRRAILKEIGVPTTTPKNSQAK